MKHETAGESNKFVLVGKTLSVENRVNCRGQDNTDAVRVPADCILPHVDCCKTVRMELIAAHILVAIFPWLYELQGLGTQQIRHAKNKRDDSSESCGKPLDIEMKENRQIIKIHLIVVRKLI